MFLVPNRHFDRLPVNVNFSAVLLPSGVQDSGESRQLSHLLTFFATYLSITMEIYFKLYYR